MSGKMSRAIVIDACIAKSAGKTDHPISKSCRDFLENTLRICHRVVTTPASIKEWKKHQSRFSLTWLASMTSKGKVIRLSTTDMPSLEKEIEDLPFTDKSLRAILKDLHLVEAALATDNVVASMDDIARNLFHQAAKPVKELRKVTWVNPTKETEQGINWLKSGARPEKKRRLGVTTAAA